MLTDRKVNNWSQAVSSLEDKPKMNATALKAAFDSNTNQLKPAINGIIDDLTADNGASNIGLVVSGVDGQNIQTVVRNIAAIAQNAQSKSNSAQSDISGIKISLSDAQEQITNAQGKISSLTSSISSTQWQVSNIESEISGISNSVSNTQQQVETFTSETETKLQNTNQTVSNMKNIVDTLNTASGASSIGVAPISGITGSNVQQVLQALSQKPGGSSSGGSSKRVCRFVIGTTTNNWSIDDCDYLCDGTDDYVEINAAIEALPQTGGEIIILDGTYNIGSSIEINKANTKLSGNGNSTILKRMWKADAAIINVNADYCVISDLQVDGNKSDYFLSGHGIYINSVSYCTIKGITCNNNSSYGVYISNSDSNVISGNVCNNSVNGISISGSTNNTITGNTCNGNSNYGVYLSTSNNNAITDNTCNNNSFGISLTGSSGNTITGDICNNNYYYGVSISNTSNNNTVTGDICNDNMSGAYISKSNNNTITGNTFIRGSGTSADYSLSQHTIHCKGDNNLIVANNIMGKDYTDEGTGNTWANNKYQ